MEKLSKDTMFMFEIIYDEYEFEDSDHSQTFSDSKERLIDYWNNAKHTAMINIKEAKKLREGESYIQTFCIRQVKEFER